MKQIRFVVLIVVLSTLSVSAQDTINPFERGYMDSINHVFRDSTSRFFVFGNDCRNPCYSSTMNHYVAAVAHTLPQTWVYGLYIPLWFDPDAFNDSIEVRGAMIVVDNNNYAHPTFYFTRPVTAVSQRPYDFYISLQHPTDCQIHDYDPNSFYEDTIMGIYSLYFEQPVPVSGTVYMGLTAKGRRNAEQNRWQYFQLCGVRHCSVMDCSNNEIFPRVCWRFEKDSLLPTLSPESQPPYCPMDVSFMPFVFPIFTAPDTDSFGCPDVEGFAFAGVYAGYPTFVWDTAGEHTLYEMAYGPYDTPTDSLHVVTTTDRFYELTGERLSADVYYQARLRAKCQHACPVHDTVMWTPWSDPIYFYTGDSMPDTSHHQPEEGIAEAQGGMTFTLTPNPARGSATLTVEGGEPDNAEGMQMTMHDAAGREVMRCTLHGRETQLPLAGLPAGLYTVSIGPARSAGGDQLSRARVARLRLLVE